jgi:probable HAF family extracellular repeat protein
MWKEGTLTDIGTLGGANSLAKGISSKCHIVGASINGNGDNRAFFWSADEGMKDLGTLGGRHSNAVAINNRGSVVGSSWTIPGESPRNPEERAFFWNESNGMQSLDALDGSWSRASDINDNDEVVGFSPAGGFTHGFLKQPNWELVDLGTLGGDTCQPMAINNKGQVIGMSETEKNISRPFIWSLDTGIHELELPPGVYIRDIDDEGYVIGDIELEIGKRSFLYHLNAQMIILPWYEHHRSEALCIGKGLKIGGQIIGIEMHCHGVIWSFKPG